MSIYPVRLSEWFTYGHEQHDTTVFICKVTRCLACGKRVRFRLAWGHHSLPWGYGELWCREKCMESGRVARLDRRRENRWYRRMAREDV